MVLSSSLQYADMLIRKEQEQIKLAASKPVPRSPGTEQDAEGCELQQLRGIKDEHGLVHHGQLLWIHNDTTTTCNVNVYDCGLLTMTAIRQ